MPWRYVRLSCTQRGHFPSPRRHDWPTTRPATWFNPPRTSWRSSSTSVFAFESSDQTLDNTSSAQKSVSDPKFCSNVSLSTNSPTLNTSIRIAGLVRSIRKHKKVAFAHISDGSTYESIQAIFSPEDARDIQNGAYVELAGQWKDSPGSGQTHELHVEQVLSLGTSDPDESPIQKKTMSVDHLRNYPHLRPRLPLYSMLARARSQVVNLAHDFYCSSPLERERAIYVQPPLITSSDCEGAGEVFTVSPRLRISPHQTQTAPAKQDEAHYFRSQKYLTVSSQLHLEAYSAELGNVWTLSPTFRAEESDTARHLSEFWMLEAEFRGTTHVENVTESVQKLIQHIAHDFRHSRVGHELRQYYSDARHRPESSMEVDLETRWNALLCDRYQTITYAEAVEALEAAAATEASTFKYKPSWDVGLQLEHERWIVEILGNNKPVFVTHYPKKHKPFYMLPSDLSAAPEDTNQSGSRQTVACFDLLLPFGTCEAVGGSLREYRLEHLIANMRQKGLLAMSAPTSLSQTSTAPPDITTTTSSPDENYPYLRPGESLNTLRWYADLRRFGSSPHGGFGMGFDRLLMYLTGVSNVRDIVAFPRTFGVAHC